MNDQTSKTIVFNKSSLLGLKAELLKKREEVHDKKQLPQHNVENYKPPPAKNKERKDHEPRNTFKDNLKAVDTEDLDACRKAKAALEKKAELYEHLADGAGNSQLASRFLVDFTTKNQQESSRPPPSPEYEPKTCTDDTDDDDEWTEFTDCLGRSRKCLKSDLHLYKQKDKELSRDVLKRPATLATEAPAEESLPLPEKPLLVQKTNDFLQSLRDRWEQKEKELLAKDKDVHYQDLLFDEARQHGVGYYSFSTDEKERREQMAELSRRREETLRAQRDAEETRRRRDELVAARVAAARARQRERQGLPPEQPTVNTKDFTTCLLEFLNKQKDDADAAAKEKETKIREEKERERQKAREAYVREWDIGKEGVEGKVKRFVEMTQEEYVEMQRSKRIDEFAPEAAAAPSSSRARCAFDEQGRKVSNEDPHAVKTWADVRPPLTKCPSPPLISDDNHQKGLYFYTSTKSTPLTKAAKYPNFVRPQSTSTKDDIVCHTTTKSNSIEGNKKSDAQYSPQSTDCASKNNSTTTESSIVHQSMKYKNFSEYQKPSSEPVWIVNELQEGPEEAVRIESTTEVAPPPTYDYYGPVAKRQKTLKPFSSDLNEAFAQGSKSLEAKTSERKLSHKYDFSLE